MNLKKVLSIASLIALPIVGSACYAPPAYSRAYYNHPYAYSPYRRVYVAPAPRRYWW